LSTPNAPAPEDFTVWGKVPRNNFQVTNAFSNIPEDRQFQDVGFDGLMDTAEVNYRSAYLAQIQANLASTVQSLPGCIERSFQRQLQKLPGCRLQIRWYPCPL
jgi:cell surface protein SprA